MKTLRRWKLSNGWMTYFDPHDGSERADIEYDPDAPCICCGLPVVEASMGGTVVCPWCDTGHDRMTGLRIIRKYGPGTPHPTYLEHYSLTLEQYLDALREQRTA